MPDSSSGPGRRGVLVATVAAGLLGVGGASALVAGAAGSGQAPPAPARTAPQAPTPAAPAADRAATSAGVDLDVQTLPWSPPVALEIPAIDVRSSTLVHLGTLPDGSLEVPEDYDLPGWYEKGPAPGQFGPAVIAGHVDSTRGPAVFFRLGELAAGDRISVRRADATTAEFVVDRVERYPKDEFPTRQVYGDTTHRAELRLITCGGSFDRETGHYRDNVVVYAHLV